MIRITFFLIFMFANFILYAQTARKSNFKNLIKNSSTITNDDIKPAEAKKQQESVLNKTQKSIVPVQKQKIEPKEMKKQEPEKKKQKNKTDFFKSSRLFIGKSIKESASARMFSFGLSFQIAPIKAAKKVAYDELKKQVPESEKFFEAVNQINMDDFKKYKNKVGDDTEKLKNYLKQNIPGITPDEAKSIDDITEKANSYPGGVTGLLDDIIELSQEKESATYFIIEPFFEINTTILSFELEYPIAGFYQNSSTDFSAGNLFMDLKFGNRFGHIIGFGLTYGVEATIPTGTKESNSVALTNIFSAPKYLHEYLSVAPYFALGVDFRLLNIQAYGKFVYMRGLRDNPKYSTISYFQGGIVAAIAPFRALTIIAELNGLKEVSNAPAFNTLYFTAGLKTSLFFLRPGIAVHIPLIQAEGSSFAGMGGMGMADPSSWNTIITLSFNL